uniref:SURP and G-patch domain-containing protein 1-like protein isoform X1 n=1 Tax=Rhizophora mucronata TaxID=61149 RepID=A0A2P2L3R8_RHIMU
MAGNVKKDNLGVGAHNPGDVTPDDDIYEQYKKRMMLGYRYRPNPLVLTLSSSSCGQLLMQ